MISGDGGCDDKIEQRVGAAVRVVKGRTGQKRIAEENQSESLQCYGGHAVSVPDFTANVIVVFFQVFWKEWLTNSTPRKRLSVSMGVSEIMTCTMQMWLSCTITCRLYVIHFFVCFCEHAVYCTSAIYRMAGNIGGKNIWRIAEIMVFGGFFFDGWVSLIL